MILKTIQQQQQALLNNLNSKKASLIMEVRNSMRLKRTSLNYLTSWIILGAMQKRYKLRLIKMMMRKLTRSFKRLYLPLLRSLKLKRRKSRLPRLMQRKSESKWRLCRRRTTFIMLSLKNIMNKKRKLSKKWKLSRILNLNHNRNLNLNFRRLLPNTSSLIPPNKQS